MSTTIDQKVVEMKFDNRDFEAKTKQTMSTLERLKSALKFPSVGKKMNDLNKSINSMDFRPLTQSIQVVQAKFSAMQIAGIAAITNLTNTAVNAGKRIVSALTIDPMKTGMQEYETQINAVQTILANTSHKGTTLDEVNAALDDLNAYADKTIYNFTQMTRNIGTFTAAGIDLETSTQSIKGIANLAAVSGSTAAQASTAMYQLSQALAAGRVSLMDWNSVVNAGMGGKVFQDALIRTSELLKTGAKEAIEIEGSFRESLTKHKWLTTEVLTETLKQLSGAYTEADLIAQGYTKKQAGEIIALAKTAEDAATKVKTFSQLIDTLKEAVQSGWTQTWEIIIGDFGEAKELFTGFSDLIGAFIGNMSDARNSFLGNIFTSSWKQLSAEISRAGLDVKEFEKKIIDVGIAKKAITEDDAATKSIEELLRSGWLKSTDIRKVIKEYTDGFSKVKQTSDDITAKFEKFKKVVHDIWNGKYKNGDEREKALTKAGYNYAYVQGLVNKTLKGRELLLEDMTEEEAAAVGITEKQYKILMEMNHESRLAGTHLNRLFSGMGDPSGRLLVFDSIKNALSGVLSVISEVKVAWNDAFRSDPDKLYDFLSRVHAFSEKLKPTEETLDKIHRTFQGLFSIINMFGGAVTNVISKSLKVLGKILGTTNFKLLDYTASFGDYIYELSKGKKHLKIIGDAFDAFSAVIAMASIYIHDAYDYISNLPSIDHLSSVWNKTVTSLKESTTSFWSKIEPIFKKFKESVEQMDKLTVDKIKSEITKLREELEALNLLGDNPMDNLYDAFKTGNKQLEEIFKACVRIFEDFHHALKRNIGEITVALYSAGAIFVGYKAVKVFDKIVGTFQGITTPLKDVFNSINKYLKVNKWKYYAEAFETFAKGVIVLSGAFYVFSKIPVKNVWNTTAVLGAVIAELTGAIAALSALKRLRIFKTSDVLAMFIPFVSFAAGLWLLSETFKSISKFVDENKYTNETLTKAGLIISGLITVFGLVASKMSVAGQVLNEGQKLGRSGWASLLATAGAIYIVAKAYEKITKIPLESAEKSMDILVRIMAGIAIIALSSRKISMAGALAIGTIGFSIYSLVNALSFLAKADMDIPLKNLQTIAAAVIVYLTIAVGLSYLTGDSKGAMLSITALGISLYALVKALSILSKLPVDALQAAVSALNSIIFVMGVFVAFTAFAGVNAHKASLTVLSLALALLAVGGITILLAKIPATRLDNVAWFVTRLGVIFGILMGLSSVVGASYKTVGAIGLTLGILATAIGLLSYFGDIEKIKTVANKLIFIMLSLSLLFYTVGKMEGVSLAPLITMSLMIVSIGGILYLLSEFGDTSKYMEIAKSLSSIMLSISAAMWIISKIKTGANFAAVISTLGSLGAILAAVTGVMAAAGLIEEVSGGLASKSILDGLPLLEAIAGGIGRVIEAFTSALFPKNDTNTKDKGILSKIGDNLSSGMKSIEPFMTTLGSLDPNLASNAETLASAMLKLTSASLLDSITSFFSGKDDPLDSFGDSLGKLGEGVSKFDEKIKDIDSENIKAAIPLLESLASLGDTVHKTGGIWQKIVGSGDLSAFADQLGPLGEGLSKFSTSLVGETGFDPDVIKDAASAMTSLGTIVGVIEAHKSLFTGDSEVLNSFGTQLNSLGKNLWWFNNWIGGEKPIDPDMMSQAAGAIKEIGDMLSQLSAVDPEVVKSVNDALSALNGDSITNFVSSVQNMAPQIQEAAALFVNTFIEGIELNKANLNAKYLEMLGIGLSLIAIYRYDYGIAAYQLAKAFKNGFKIDGLADKLKSELNNALREIKKYRDDFEYCGKELAEGLAEGIRKNAHKAVEAASAMAAAAAAAANKKVEVKSPSRVTMMTGMYFAMGMAMGILNHTKEVKAASERMAEEATRGLNDSLAKTYNAITMSWDDSPVIRPLVDTSNILATSKLLDSVFASDTASSISASMDRRLYSNSKIEEPVGKSTIYEFTQNNYSPKALSKIDIYRQTRNQFAELKGRE